MRTFYSKRDVMVASAVADLCAANVRLGRGSVVTVPALQLVRITCSQYPGVYTGRFDPETALVTVEDHVIYRQFCWKYPGPWENELLPSVASAVERLKAELVQQDLDSSVRALKEFEATTQSLQSSWRSATSRER